MFSKNLKKPLTLKNALVQNFAGGNTMVFNNNLHTYIKKIGFVDVHSHDWWLYIITTAIGGKIIYDKNSYISYRQHDENLVGANNGIHNAIIRIKKLMLGEFRSWNKKNMYHLMQNKKIISKKNMMILNDFKKVQDGNIYERFIYYFKSGVYRQNFYGNIAVFIFALLKKL